jgi:putative endopeptidase
MKVIYGMSLVSVCLILSFTKMPKTGGNPPDDPLNFTSHDNSVRPQDNFYLFANGNWINKIEIPASQSNWGSFSIMQDSSVSRLHRILDSISQLTNVQHGSVAQQTGDLFYSAMDSTGIEQRGYMPVKWELDSINAINNQDKLYNEIAKEYAINHGPFFNFGVGPDSKNSRFNIAQFYQGGLGLPSRDYYFKMDSPIIKIRTAYKFYISKIFLLIGQSPNEAANAANDVFDVETALAKISKAPQDLRDPIANYHKIVVSTVPDLKNLLSKLNVFADTVLVGQPDFYKGLDSIIKNTPLDKIKNYLSFHVVNDDADYMPAAFVNAKFEFTRTLSGQRQMKERWKRMISLVDQQLGDALGQIYVQKYFTASDKERINQLVDNILSTYAERIQKLDWMSDSTKQKALVKLRAIVKKVGFPDKWKDYSSIEITRHDIIANLRATALYRYKRDLAKIGQPVDRTEWHMTAPTINAYYSPTENNINFPAGILQPPFYFSKADDAVNYGGIGFVIGHEITHGFDDQGRNFDAEGNLNNWWSVEDGKRFKERAKNIINQYNGYIAIDTFHINGLLTEGENIADNGGLSIAYAAFKKTEQGKSNKKINGYTADQRFFLSAAQVWQKKARRENLISQVMTDPHSMAMWRVNGPVSNMPSFYEAFHVLPTDPMYRPDSLRVKIW